MAHREFTDSVGRHWDVWSVIPERAERRIKTESIPTRLERRQEREEHEYRVTIGEQWTRGWLTFETHGEKRRLAPIPEGWDESSVEELERLCETASLAPKPRRLAE